MRFIPNDFVQGFLKNYSPEELELIQMDLNNIRNMCFHKLTVPEEGKKVYVSTAGGPGASKSTILEKWLKEHPNFAYLDPDQRSLIYMINTYRQEFTNLKYSENPDYPKLSEAAYTKWRAASNYIASTLINEASEKGFNIAHGTTATAPQVEMLYKKLKANGYKIILLLCCTTDENRVKANEHRAQEQNLVQVDAQDIINKGKMFPERFDVYFRYADEMELYWVDNFKDGSIRAATLHKGQKPVIHDQSAFNKLRDFYENAREDARKENKEYKEWPSLDDLIKNYK
jgi:predicted ABC-type ATPase